MGAEFTFGRLCEMEPRLRELELFVREFAELYGARSPRCANAAWYGHGEFWGKGVKPRLVALVGDHRSPPGFVKPAWPFQPGDVVAMSDPRVRRYSLDLESAYLAAVAGLDEASRAHEPALRSSGAYDVAYDHLYSLLPDCKGCGCM